LKPGSERKVPMFDAESLKKIDSGYFNIILMDDRKLGELVSSYFIETRFEICR